MLKQVFNCKRGKAPEIVEIVQAFNQMFMANEGFENGRIYVDMTGRMDTVIYQFEVESLDNFYKLERGLFVNPDEDTIRAINTLNENTEKGTREIYEVISSLSMSTQEN
jgi:hypothetical protein